MLQTLCLTSTQFSEKFPERYFRHQRKWGLKLPKPISMQVLLPPSKLWHFSKQEDERFRVKTNNYLFALIKQRLLDFFEWPFFL